MVPTYAPTTTSRRRRKVGVRVGLLVGAVIVLVAGVALATVTVEPLRVNHWAYGGTSCGTVTRSQRYGEYLPTTGGSANEQCLQRAAQRCQAATLDYIQDYMDTSESITLVIEPAVPALAPCGIAAVWEGLGEGIGGGSRLEHCASLALQSDGLHVYGCGSLGDIVVPA